MKRLLLILALALPWLAHGQGHFDANDNTCINYFYKGYTDTAKAVFKQVMETDYKSGDSTMKDLRFSAKEISQYNSAGLRTLDITIDSNMVVTDSTRWVYNKHNDLIYQYRYETNDSSGKMERVHYETWRYDAKDRMLKDSSYEFISHVFLRRMREDADDTDYSDETKVEVSTHRYNDAANTETDSTFTKDENGLRDTTYEFDRYDKQHQLLYSYTSEWPFGHVNKQYNRYDATGAVIFNAVIDEDDSVSTYYSFDADSDQVGERTYNGRGKLTYSDTIVYPKDGSMIETKEEIPETEDAASCPNNTITVTTTDSNGRQLSEVITEMKNGKPHVTTITDRYYKTGNKEVDSTFSIARWHFYSHTSKSITTDIRDSAGRVIDETRIGGGEYADNKHETQSYNKKGKPLHRTDYNSCVADKPVSEEIYVYWPDDTTPQMRAYIEVSYKDIDYYSAKGRKTKMIHGFKSQYWETVYEYKD